VKECPFCQKALRHQWKDPNEECRLIWYEFSCGTVLPSEPNPPRRGTQSHECTRADRDAGLKKIAETEALAENLFRAAEKLGTTDSDDGTVIQKAEIACRRWKERSR